MSAAAAHDGDVAVQQSPPAVLKILAEDGTRREMPLVSGEILVGRAVDSQLVLESTTVSRHHARLLRDPYGRWQVHDLDSRNGTLINGRAVKEQTLRSGDRIQIGSFALMLEIPAPPAPGGDDVKGAERPRSDSARAARLGHAIIAEHPSLRFSDEAGRLSTLNDLEPPRVSAAHLTALNQLTRQLLETADPEERALMLCRTMAGPQFHGDWAVTLSLPLGPGPDEIGQPRMLCEPQHASPPRQALHVSRTLLRAVTRQDDAVMASNVGSGGGLVNAAGAGGVEMSIAPGVMSMAAVACPIERHGAQAIDLLYVTLPPQYGTGEWLALCSLAAKQYQQAEGAWAARTRDAAHAAFARELEQARQIQLRLIPKAAALAKLREKGLDVAVGFSPSRFVGGDYADAVAMADGRVLLVLADVCGHGLAAALLTSVVHTLVHAAVRRAATVAEVVQGLNQHLCETLPGDSFVTLVAVALNPSDGSMEYLNAGHPPPFAVAAEGAVRQLPAGQNLPLGIDAAAPEGPTAERLHDGELLVVYSDGLNEQTAAAGGSMLGIAALKEEVCRLSRTDDAASDPIARALTHFLAAHRGDRSPDDDQSFLLLRRV